MVSLNCFPSKCPFPNKPVNRTARGIARKKALFEDVCEIIQPQTILEVGSWMGASAIAWKQASGVHKKESKVYCIDTWLGSPEHYLSTCGDEWNRERLSISNKGPQYFDDFLSNIHGAAYENYILPMRADSQSALAYLTTIDALFDVIYIDGAHDEISVFRDIIKAYHLVSERGIICGDDFGWSSVRTGLLLAMYDNSTPRLVVLYKDNDFIIASKSSKCLIDQFKSRGYLIWRPWKQLARISVFTAKKLINAIQKL